MNNVSRILDEFLTVSITSLNQGSHKWGVEEIVQGFSEALVMDFREAK